MTQIRTDDTAQREIDLSIIIVTWNVWDLLHACLRSIEQLSRPADSADDPLRNFGPPEQSRTLEVIVVDNGGTDATPERIPAHFPWVRFMRQEENLGFTVGNNCGYGASRGRFVYFLNPDTQLLTGEPPSGERMDDSLWTLYQTIRADSTIGLVGPQLRHPDHTLQESRRRFPSRFTGFFESTWLGRLLPRNPWERRLHMADQPPDFRQDVDWLSGAALFARRDGLEAVQIESDSGPFDERFFMYSEELDLCQRLKQAGWRVVYVPEAVIVHYGGGSSEQAVAARDIHFHTSKVRYYAKYYGTGWAEVLRRYLLLEYRGQLWLERLKYWLGHKRSLRTERIAAYQEVLASRFR